MVSGWLLYRQEDYEKNKWFADAFCEAGPEFGFTIALKLVEELPLLLDGAGELPAFAINRARDAGLAAFLEQAGCRVFNSAEVTGIGNDKWRSHLLAKRLGLPQVETAHVPNNPAALINQPLGWPAVVKHPAGHGGGQVALVQSPQELAAAAASFGCPRVLLQRLCGLPGVDLRVYVLGGRVLQAVERRAAEGFRANLSLGGTVRAVALPPEVAPMVEALCAALPLDWAGIDFIADGLNRWLFNEIEDAVGARSLYALGGFDPVRLVLAHIRAVLG